MIISNEPGYYKPGGYGIRIENLLLAVESEPAEDSGRPMLAFETITFAPFHRRLIEPTLLDLVEAAWVDVYPAAVRTRVMRMEARRVGRAWVCACIARWVPLHTKNIIKIYR